MAWLPLHNEPERALAEEWLSWLDEGDLLRDDRFEVILQHDGGPIAVGRPAPAVGAARLARGALLAHACSGLPAWRERSNQFLAFLMHTLPSDTGDLSDADLAEIQQAFCLAWSGTAEEVWLEPMLKLAEELKTRLESSTAEDTTPDPWGNRVATAARLARTAVALGHDTWLAWIADLIHEQLNILSSGVDLEKSDGTGADRPDMGKIAGMARMLRALVEVDACKSGFDIAESLPVLYRQFRDAAAMLDDPVYRKQAARDARTALAWCEAATESIQCHAALIERFPGAARLAWMVLRDLWWRWRDPETWWLIPRALRRRGIPHPGVWSPTLLVYAGLPDYLLGMSHYSQPLFE